MSVEPEDFQLLNSDQQRESVNTRQKFDHVLELQQRSRHDRASMTFASVGGTAYLLRSYYDQALVSRFLPHLRFEPATLRHLPKAVVTDAEPLFGVHGSPDADFTWP